MVELRDYQNDLVTGIRSAFTRSSRVLAVSPTGSGKTVVFSYVTKGAEAKGNSVILCAHRSEIVDQISKSLDRFGVRHGRIQPRHAMATANCHVAMVQTLGNRLDRIPAPRLLVVDESHHCVSATYSKILEAWPDTKVLGVTATPKRLDGKGLGKWFDEMVIGPTSAELIKGGYLAGYQYLAPPSDLDLDGIKSRAGDFAIDAIAEAVEKSSIMGDAVNHYRDHLNGRPAIAFCVTVAHAQMVAEQFREAGYRAASVDGTMDKETRAERMAGIGNGELQVLTSCELISEGVDIPVVSGAILLRPTQSLAMHLQQVGRVLRPKADGSQAVILDHVGNVKRHGLPDAERMWSLADQKKTATPKTVTCDACYKVFSSDNPKWKDTAICPADPEGKEDIELLTIAKRYDQAGIKDDRLPEAIAYAATSERTIECVLIPGAGAPRGLPDAVEGTLQIVTPTPDWARGANIAADPLSSFMFLAETEDQLKEVARMRRYHPKWVKRVLAAKSESAAKLADQERIRFGE